MFIAAAASIRGVIPKLDWRFMLAPASIRIWKIMIGARNFKILYYTGSAILRQSGREPRNRLCRKEAPPTRPQFCKIPQVPEEVLTGDEKLTSMFSIYLVFHAILSIFRKKNFGKFFLENFFFHNSKKIFFYIFSKNA